MSYKSQAKHKEEHTQQGRAWLQATCAAPTSLCEAALVQMVFISEKGQLFEKKIEMDGVQQVYFRKN